MSGKKLFPNEATFVSTGVRTSMYLFGGTQFNPQDMVSNISTFLRWVLWRIITQPSLDRTISNTHFHICEEVDRGCTRGSKVCPVCPLRLSCWSCSLLRLLASPCLLLLPLSSCSPSLCWLPLLCYSWNAPSWMPWPFLPWACFCFNPSFGSATSE